MKEKKYTKNIANSFLNIPRGSWQEISLKKLGFLL